MQSDTVSEYNNADPFAEEASQETTYDENRGEEDITENFDESHFDKLKRAPETVHRTIPEEKWRTMSEDPAFIYTEDIPAPQEEGWWVKFSGNMLRFLLSPFGKFLEIGLVVALVLFIVFRIVKLNGNIFFSKKDKKLGNASADELEDYIPEDWEKIIHDAAQSGDFRLALRHSYRYLLSMLQTRELIQYQVAKTNYQYVYELSGSPYYNQFRQLTRDYEYAWYGGFEIEKAFFDKYFSIITGLKKELNY